ncbi:MAG: metallophosphoesterase family protein [Alphaproteobacteria bacterium]|nr:metallophosphoesterase family protein [Alphaproteobacteria bacterium]
MTSLPAVNDGICLYAIGDIHGHTATLRQLLGEVLRDAKQHPNEVKRLVFLGDYIDRGPDSRGVIDLLLHDLPHDYEVVFLRGNHEDVALRVMEGESDLIESWMQFGGGAFFSSYGVDPFRPRIMETPEILRMELQLNLPAEHRGFLEQTSLSHICGDYYFAHAGVRPGVPLDKQEADDLLWIRDEFIHSGQDFGKIVVHGHSIKPEPDVQHNRIGIDTGAFESGRLTCLKLVGTERTFLST